MGAEWFLLSKFDWHQSNETCTASYVDARGVEAEFRGKPITDAKAVKSVVEKFREKYGAKDVKKYYSKFDVAVVLELQSTGS